MLLLHSSEWAGAIVQSFRTAADMAGSGHGISPANVLEIALDIVTKLAPKHNAPKTGRYDSQAPFAQFQY